jgi:penicillin-binding protein 2
LAKFEVNALGKTQRLLSTTAATYGRNLQSTLDAQLSTLAYQAMKGKQGAVVILDAKNGAVLTLLSAPSFDPNLFNDSKLHQKEIRAYLQDERKVFFNRALSGSYPPGSVFKLVTAVAALQESAIDADSQVQDEGVLKVGDFSYANWYYTQYGRVEGAVDLQKALARSNDIFFYKAAEWLGPTKLANYSRMFGLGERSGIEAMSENRGLVPDPAWKEKQRGEPWYLGNTYHFGIGQGDLLVSPLQVASMTQAIANQGVLCQPTLLSEKAVQCRSLALDQDNVDQVIKGMVSACSSGGTAYPIFPLNEKYPNLVACKTGTAEFGAADDRGYRPTHAWLTAIVNLLPEQLPHLPRQLIITVLVESDEAKIYREGSQDAAPVVAEILIGLGL